MVIIEACAFAVRRVVACKETLQGVRERGVMADLLVTTLIVRYGPEASPHILWVVAVEVLLNVRTCILPAGFPYSDLFGLCYRPACHLTCRQHPGL